MSPLDTADDPRPASIPRRTDAARKADPVDFHALRAFGIERAQAASGQNWTDYNLHDPGVTILEQLAFALTELTYRIDFPVADHLTGPDGRIDFERQALFPPEQILPCRPTTANDYRHLLLDQIRGLRDASFVADKDLPGLHRLRLGLGLAHQATSHDDEALAKIADAAHALYRSNRGLCQDLDRHISFIEPRLYDLRLAASISGDRDPADILADIYHVCASAIAGPAPAHGFDELVRAGIPVEEIFDGPELRSGRIDATDLDEEGGCRLVVGDLRALVLKVEGVAEVTKLDLWREDETVARILDWTGQTWAPRLRVPLRGNGGTQAQDAADQSLVRLSRRGADIPVNPRAVERRYADSMQPSRSDRMTSRDFAEVQPPPRGTHRPPGTYDPVQNHFPAIYGLGARGAPDGTLQGWARSQQLKAYLTLFDQVLANGAAQLDHVRDLFTPDGPREQSYWRRVLGEEEVAGIEELYARTAPEIHALVHEPFDEADERRDRVLDYLLALYGENLAQDSMRQFLDYLSSSELSQALVANKVTFLKQTVVMGRHRAGGVDYGFDPWTPEHTPALQRRICLLAGFRFWHARHLTAPFGDGQGPAARRAARKWTMDSPEDPTRPLSWAVEPRPLSAEAARTRRLLRQRNLLGVLLEHGVYRRCYRWEPRASGGGRLWLACEQEGAWWSLANVEDETAAANLADAMRRKLIDLNDACEGLHIVEHILLRRRAEPVDPAFHALRATFVFPDWTARTSRPAFRDFVEETVNINCPAHVAPAVLWLGFDEMQAFEKLYACWTAALQDYSKPPHPATVLNEAGADLADFLAARLPSETPAS